MIPNYQLFKEIFSIIVILDLILMAPFFNRYIGREYNPKSIFKNRLFTSLIFGLILVSGISIFLNLYSTLGALSLLIVYRYIHIDQRFNSLSRGAGAVGYMPYHCAFFIFTVETFYSFGAAHLVGSFYSIYIIEVAVIYICAGLSKGLAGYTKGNGFEIALVNPFWSNFFLLFKRIRPDSSFFKIQNYFGFMTEIACGILLLFPETRIIGAILIVLIFGYILLVLNLGLLPLLMICSSVLFLPDLGISFQNTYSNELKIWDLELIPLLLIGLFKLYVTLVILVKVYLYFKVFGKNKWKINKPIAFLEKLALYVPIFIWRVFTADVTNVFVRITKMNKQKEVIWDENVKSNLSFANLVKNYRFYHVSEMVVLTTIFNQLKYPKAGIEEVKERLSRYVKSLSSRLLENDVLCFELVKVESRDSGFKFQPIMKLMVNCNGKVLEVENIVEDPISRLKFSD